MALSNAGAVYGSVKCLQSGSVHRVTGMVLCGLLGVMGMIMGIILAGNIRLPEAGHNVYSLYSGFSCLAAGLCCGLTNLSASVGIGHILCAKKNGRDWSLLADTENADDPEGIRGYRDGHHKEPSGCFAIGVVFTFGIIGYIMAYILFQNEYVC